MAINGIPEGFELVEEEIDTKVNIPEGFELVQDETQEVSVPEGFELIEEKQPLIEQSIEQPEIDIEAIKKQKALDFKKGRFLMSEIKAKEKFDLTGEVDINLLSEESLNPEKSLLLDYGSQFANTILQLAKGGEEFKTMGNMLAAKYAMDIFKPDLSDEEKSLVIKGIKQIGDVGNLGLDKSIEALNKNLRVYETESMIDDFNKGDYGQFTERLVGQTIGAIPSILLTSTGWGGIIAQGASSAGSKFSELVEENPDESLERLAFNSLTTGALESAFEIGTRGVLKRAGLLLDRGAKKAASDLIDNWMTKFSKYLDIPLEGVFEAGTTLSQDLLDALKRDFGGLGKSEGMSMSEYFEKRGTAKKMWEAFSVGTMMGGGVNLTGALKSNKQLERDKAEYILTPESDRKIIQDAAININNLNQQIKEVNNKEDISVLEAEIAKEEDKIIDTKKKVSEELNMMNPDELKAYARNIEQINKENKRAKSNSIFIKEANAQKLVDLELENEALIRESVDRRLDENIKTVGVEDLGRTVNDYNTKEDYQKAYDNTEVGKKNSMNVTSSDGFIDTEGDIYVNKEVAQKVRNVNVAAHELLHGILNNNIKEPGQLKRLVNEFKAILPKETADLIQKRIDDNYRFTTDEQGNRVERPESEYMEEYFTAFADLIGNRKVKFNENIFTKIGEKITPIFKGKGYGRIRFETGKDVYDFIKSYQKQIAKGELKPETIEAAKKVTDQDIKTEFSKTIDLTKQSNQDKLNDLVGPTNEEGFYTVSKQDFTGSQSETVAKQLVDNGAFDNLIGKKIKVTDPKQRQDILEDSKEEIKLHIERFNPSLNKSLFGYINSYIGAKVGTVAKKALKAPKTVSTDKKIGGEESRATIGETLLSDEISPEEYADIKLAQDKIKKIKPQQSKIAKKIDLTDNEINLVKRDITNFLRKTDRPAMTDPKKFFKAFVDYVSTATGNRLYDKLSAPKDGLLSTKNRKAFIESIAEDLIALNKVDPSVMRRSNWNIFYELEIKNMNPTQTQKAIDEGRIPSTTNLKAGNDLFKTLDPSVDQVVDYLMNIRPDVFKRKMPKFLAEVIAKNEFNNIVNNKKQPIYDTKGNETDRTIDLSESVTEEEVKRGAPQVREKIARPEGIKFSITSPKLKEKASLTIAKDKKGSNVFRPKNIKITRQEKLDQFDVGIVNPKEKGKKYSTRDLSQKLPSEIAATENETVGDGVKRVLKNFIADNPQFYRATKDSTTSGTERGLVSTKDVFNKFIGSQPKVDQKTKRFPYTRIGGFAMPKFINLTKQSGFVKTQKDQLNSFIEYFKAIENYLAKNPNDAWVFDALVKDAQDNQNSIFRYSSPVFFMHVDSNGKFVFNVSLREEHSSPQNNIATMLLDAAINGYVDDIAPIIKAMSMQGGLTRVDDTKLDVDFKSTMPDFFWDEIVPKIINNEVKLESGIAAVIRMTEAGVNLDNYLYFPANKTFSEHLFGSNGVPQADQAELTRKYLSGKISLSESRRIGKQLAESYSKTKRQELQAKKLNIKELSNSVVKFSKTDTNKEIIGYAKTVDEALKISRDPNAPIKKIRVFDFDDTLATTKSDVLFTAPDGTEGSLTAEKFAMDGARLLSEGYVFDFSEFNKVTKGKPGPLLDIAKKIQAARGTEDVFVLTARAPEAQVAIKEFLDSVGLNVPLENITGLGNSTGVAKANWMVEKAAEGYNDFYFADDAYQNVKAVKDAMSVLDVKSKVQQAKIKFSKSVNEDFNKIIEQTTGIASEKVYSEAKAKVRGANKGNKKFFIPYSAEDFMGLIYPLLSKGKLGDSQMAWFKQNLLDPYARAQENISADRLQLMEDFKALKKALEVPKDLRKKTDSGFTKEQAVRVYLFNKAGFDVPGISKTDLNELLDLVNSDGVLKAFGDQIFNITKGDGYAKPGENWLVGTITTDLIDVLNTVKRAKYLEQSGYTANAELIFSKENLNKLEAAYGSKYREAMENILGRMKSGKNRIFSGNRLSNRVLDYINNSTGAIMFFNTRSAVLQTISSINFLNWSFNNPIKAGAAFANQPQYWKDFVELINSDYLVDRRNGLKLNINESEIADAAATSKNKAKAAINYILQKGFLPTQYADSFAIASGGATFYRNRINDLVKNQGMSEADAKKQAMLEWRETAEISQQSSDPSKISAQQASDLGRVILAFANTPMQYARIQKRAVQDLVNGRGDAKTNVSKIIYYAVVQNLIFNALQSALFGLGFGDDEDDEKKEKMYLRTANGMLDSQLRGLGLAGATVAVIKNFLTDIYERSGRKRPEYVDSIYKLLQISPPISSKISKIRGAAYQFDSKKRREEIFEKGFSIDNPAYEAGAKVISATANIPLDRVYSKVDNISGSMDEDAETWQTIAMLAGWPKWQIMPKDKTSSELPKFEGRKVKKFSKSNYKNWKKKRYSKR